MTIITSILNAIYFLLLGAGLIVSVMCIRNSRRTRMVVSGNSINAIYSDKFQRLYFWQSLIGVIIWAWLCVVVFLFAVYSVNSWGRAWEWRPVEIWDLLAWALFLVWVVAVLILRLRGLQHVFLSWWLLLQNILIGLLYVYSHLLAHTFHTYGRSSGA